MKTRIWPVMRKEFRELRRDPLLLGIAAAVPLVFLFLFGYAIGFDIHGVPMAVVDYDRSRESAALVEAFVHTGHFAVHRRPITEREVGRLLDAGDVRLALVIPPGFGRELQAGRKAIVQTLLDGSFSFRAAVIRNEADAVTAAFSVRRLADASGEARPVSGVGSSGARARVWYNPGLQSAVYIVPGLFAVILMAFPPLLTALGIVREKESGSVQQIYVSPLRPWEFIAGKMLPYVAIAFAEVVLVTLVGVWWFRVPFRGSPIILLVGSVLYVFCTVGIGVLVSTLTRSQVVAILLAMIVTVMPSMQYSGFLYPISSMPLNAQVRTYLFPGRYFMEVIRGTFLKGTGVAELWGQLALLAGYTLVVFWAAVLRFHKKVA